MENSTVIILGIIYWAIIILMIAAMWKVFAKANEPGWACLIPIYNIIVLLRIIGKDWTNIFWVLLPIIGLVVLQIIMVTGLSRVFGKAGTGFGAGLFFLPFIFYPILGFGGAKFEELPNIGLSLVGNTDKVENEEKSSIKEEKVSDNLESIDASGEKQNLEIDRSELYKGLKEILPNGNPYAFNTLAKKYGNSAKLINELCRFINNPDEVVVDKADAIEVLGMMSVPNNLKTMVSDTFIKAMKVANQQSKDDLHPVKTEIKKARMNLMIN